MAGLTPQGFTPKTQDEIKSDIEEKLKAFFGPDLNLSPGSRFGQIVEIFSFELADTWLALQADYNSRFRTTATGNNLDYVGTLTNCVRKYETKSTVSCFLGSVNSNVLIDAFSRAQVSGGDDRQFFLDTQATITDNNFLVILSEAATAGNLSLQWTDLPEVSVEVTSSNLNIATQIANSLGIDSSSVIVSGSLTDAPAAIHIKFVSNTPGSLPVADASTLTKNLAPVTVDTYFSTANNESFTGIDSTAEEIPAGVVQEIATPNNRWNAVINFASGLPGKPRETDAEYRLRMSTELSRTGTATFAGFSQQLSTVANVQTVNIIENDTAVVDEDGRPPHSFECYVEGGSDDEVAQAIYDYKPLGIKNDNVTTKGTPAARSGAIVTANGGTEIINFSSPIRVNVFVKVRITITPDFPTDGIQSVKQAIARSINFLIIGEELRVYTLYTPLRTVPGINTAEIGVSVLGTPSVIQTENITPDVNQRLVTNLDIIDVEVIV